METPWLQTTRPVLRPDGVDVWRLPLDLPRERVERMGAVLAAEELARASRFVFERDRGRYVAAHGRLRQILGQYLAEAPLHIRFETEPGGKPRLADHPEVRFNLAHSAGLGLIAVAQGREVGIDVEQIRDLADGVEGLASICMSEGEHAAWRGLPERERRAAFFSTWTRKEAYLKARGDGLARALDSFDVAVPPHEAQLLRVISEPSEPERWTLKELAPGSGYVATVAFQGVGTVRGWTWRLEEEDGSGGAGSSGAPRGRGEPRGAVLGGRALPKRWRRSGKTRSREECLRYRQESGPTCDRPA